MKIATLASWKVFLSILAACRIDGNYSRGGYVSGKASARSSLEDDSTEGDEIIISEIIVISKIAFDTLPRTTIVDFTLISLG